MESTLVILGTVAGVVGTLIAVVAFLRSRRREATQVPYVQTAHVVVSSRESMAGESVPIAVEMSLENHGESTAKDIHVAVRLFVVLEDRFQVPGDDEVEPLFATHLDALGAGSSRQVIAYPIGGAFHEGRLPLLDPEGVIVVKTTTEFKDAVGKRFTNRDAVTAPPPGFEVTGYDHSE